jgi:peroxiredoxin
MLLPTAANVPREGQLLPALTLPAAGGGEVRVRAYRGRRALCLIFVHGAACSACRDYLTGALHSYAAYAEEDGEVIAVLPDSPANAVALRADLALPFPVAVDAAGAACRRYGLRPGEDAAVMLTDRYGAPSRWQAVSGNHDFPAHDRLVADLRYLAMTCSAGCAVPLWEDD